MSLSKNGNLTAPAGEAENRPLLTGIGRGFTRHCPNCGRGHLFDGYFGYGRYAISVSPTMIDIPPMTHPHM